MYHVACSSWVARTGRKEAIYGGIFPGFGLIWSVFRRLSTRRLDIRENRALAMLL
jgi:drug/metabolite transporter superfamily protein YnfA